MRVYIAGPCTGQPDHGFPAFAQAAEQLAARGFEPVNPTRGGVIAGFDWHDYMRLALRDLVFCDAVALLPGWKNSRGATWEFRIADEILDIPVMPLTDWLNYQPSQQQEEAAS